MRIERFEEQNYLFKICTESHRIILEKITPRVELGYVQMLTYSNKLRVSDLWVHENTISSRGQGLGTMLMARVLEYAQEKNFDLVFGNTAKNDLRVHKFYKKCGYSILIDDKRDTAWFINSLIPKNYDSTKLNELAELCFLTGSKLY